MDTFMYLLLLFHFIFVQQVFKLPLNKGSFSSELEKIRTQSRTNIILNSTMRYNERYE